MNRVLKLSEMRPEQRAVITGYRESEKKYRRKLLSFGLTPGTELMMKKTAPFGDPVEIIVRGYSLSLRKAEADVLELEENK